MASAALKLDFPEPPKIEDNLGLAHMVARKFIFTSEKVEDSEEYAICCMKLCEAIKTWTPEIALFSTYACDVMKNALIANLRSKKCSKRKANFEFLRDKDWQQIGGNEEEPQIEEEVLPSADQILEILPTDTNQEIQDKTLLKRFYLEGVKAKDLAEELGVSRVRVYQRIAEAAERIRRKFYNR